MVGKGENMTSESKGIFVRESSGLVRVATSASVFMFNIFWTAFGFVLCYVFLWAPNISPGANLGLGLAFCAILVIPITGVYALFAAIMPRSGGDYHYVSRSLHPSLGFMVSWSWSVWLAFWACWGAFAFTSYGLGPILGTWGAITRNQGLVDWGLKLGALGETTSGTFIIGAIVLVLFALLAIAGTRLYFNLQKIAFAILLIGLVTIFALIAVNSPADFAAKFNAAFNWQSGSSDTYNQIITDTQNAGVDVNPPFAFRPFLLLVPLGFTYMPYCIGSTFMAGEIKDVKKAQIYGGPIATVFLGLFSMILGLLYVLTIGTDFYYGIGAAWWGNIEYNIRVLPYFPTLIGVLTSNPIIFLVISIGYLVWGVWFVPQNIMLISRNMLAWSFDRIAPEKLSEVNEQTHTPIFNIIIVLIAAEIFLVIFHTTAWITMVSSIFALCLIILLVGISAIIFPYRRKKMYEESVVAEDQLFGIPILVLAGIWTVAVTLLCTYFYLTEDNLFANAPESLWMIVVIFLSGLILYFVAWWYRRSEGIDIELAFQEIAPE